MYYNAHSRIEGSGVNLTGHESRVNWHISATIESDDETVWPGLLSWDDVKDTNLNLAIF